jgi:hypothetical protein
MILVEVPSTAPLFGVDGLQTESKLRFVGYTKADNSSFACSKVSERLDISYDKLKAMLVKEDKEGFLTFERHTVK